MPITIEDLNATGNYSGAAALFRDYADWLEEEHGIEPETHGIDREIASLPGAYGPPDGALLAAGTGDGGFSGCIALRRLDATTCEVKRLYVSPGQRGQHIAVRLVEALISRARALGYTRIALDVGDYQRPARALYTKCGFSETAPSDRIAYPGVVFMARDI